MPKDKARPLGQTGAVTKCLHFRVLAGAVAVLLCALPALAQDLDPIRPQDYKPVEQPKRPQARRAPTELPEPVIDVPADDTVVVEELKAVVFVSDPHALTLRAPQEGDVVTEGVDLLDCEEFRSQIEPYIGKPLTWRNIREIIEKTIMYYRSKDRPVVDPILTEQDIGATGVLQLLIVEGRVAQVSVEGNKWFTDEQIRDSLRLQPGDVIRTKQLLADIDFINRNPFRYVTPVLTPGEGLGATNVILQAEDRLPYRFYVGYEDTGSRETGLDRYIVGVNMGNVLNKQIELGYQFASNHALDAIGVHSAYLRVPLANRHIFALNASLAHYHARHRNVDYQGNSWQISPRYIIPFAPRRRYRSEVQFGFDFERNSNHLDYLRSNAYDGSVDTTQFALEYAGALEDDFGKTSFTWAAYWSPCGMSSKADKSDYHRARPGADPEYFYSNFSLERVWDLPYEASLVNRFIGQLSTDRLLGGEQLGLGGYNTVRGYDEREVNSDEGLILSVELRSPEVRFAQIAGKGETESSLQFLTFWDYGLAHNISHYPGEDKDTTLQSVGVGVRYKLGQYVSFRMDYGFRCEDLREETGFNDQGRFHIGLLVAY